VSVWQVRRTVRVMHVGARSHGLRAQASLREPRIALRARGSMARRCVRLRYPRCVTQTTRLVAAHATPSTRGCTRTNAHSSAARGERA
jgi:hypothetical protein